MNDRLVSPTAAGRWAAFGLATTGVGVALVIWFAARVNWTTDGLGTPSWPSLLVTIVSFGVAGALLVDRRPDLPFGWLLSAAALSQVLYAATALPALAAAPATMPATSNGGRSSTKAPSKASSSPGRVEARTPSIGVIVDSSRTLRVTLGWPFTTRH